MTEATRPDQKPARDRGRADTDRQIRAVARELLVTRGRAAVTLRAIARELGITAPALYRYYSSFEDLIHHVCLDICTDLASELTGDLATISDDDTVAKVFAVCRGFRSWAIRHPQEFALVFATPYGPTGQAVASPASDAFGRIFLTVAGRVLTTRPLVVPNDADVPAALRADLTEFRRGLFEILADTGIVLGEDVFTLGAAYAMLRFWVRLYGQVALEVFRQFPFAVSDPEPLFEAMVAELAAEVGLCTE